MATNVIANGLMVALGFQVDKVSMSAFTKSIGTAKRWVNDLAKSVRDTALGLVELADTAARAGTTVQELERLSYVAGQTGGSVQAARESLERLRSAAGEAALGVGHGVAVFADLGLEAKDSSGELKSTSALLAEVGQKIKGMGAGEQLAFLQHLGIDASMVRALTEDVSALNDEFDRVYGTAGVNANEAAVAAAVFMNEWGKLEELSSQIYRAVNVNFMMAFKDDLVWLRELVFENAEKITTVIMRLASAIGTVITRVIKLLIRLADWFGELDDDTKDLILTIGGLIAAWRILNLGFLATPIGMLVAGLTALFLVVDDLLTYLESGESYFDWSEWIPGIESMSLAFEGIKATAAAVFAAITPIVRKAIEAIVANFQDIAGTAINIFGRLQNLFSAFFENDGPGVVRAFIGIVQEIINLFLRIFELSFGVVLDIIEAVFGSEARMIVENFVDAVLGFIRAFVSDAVSWINAFADDFGAIFNILKIIVETTFGVIVSTVEMFVAILTGIFNGLTALIMGDWEGLSASIMSIIDALISWFQTVPLRIVQAIAGVFDALVDPFKRAAETAMGLWNNFMGLFRRDKKEVDEARGRGEVARWGTQGTGLFGVNGLSGELNIAYESANNLQGSHLAPSLAQQQQITNSTEQTTNKIDMNTTINVNGSGDPLNVARIVEGNQKEVSRYTVTAIAAAPEPARAG